MVPKFSSGKGNPDAAADAAVDADATAAATADATADAADQSNPYMSHLQASQQSKLIVQ